MRPALITKGITVEVVRGARAGGVGVVNQQSDEHAGFWWVNLYDANGKLGLAVLLQEGQLKRKEPPA